MAKPAFDPNKPFEAVEDSKPAFDPSKPFEVEEGPAPKRARDGKDKIMDAVSMMNPAPVNPLQALAAAMRAPQGGRMQAAKDSLVKNITDKKDFALKTLNVLPGMINEGILAPITSAANTVEEMVTGKDLPANPWNLGKAMAGNGRTAEEVLNTAGHKGPVAQYAGLALDMASPIGAEKAIMTGAAKIGPKAAQMMGRIAPEVAAFLTTMTDGQKAAMKANTPAFIETVKRIKNRGMGDGTLPISRELQNMTMNAERQVGKQGADLAAQAKAKLAPHEIELNPEILDFIEKQDPESAATKQLMAIFFGDENAAGNQYRRQVQANAPLNPARVAGSEVQGALPLQTAEKQTISTGQRKAAAEQMPLLGPEKSFETGVIEGWQDQMQLPLQDPSIRTERLPPVFSKTPAKPLGLVDEATAVTAAIQDPLNLPMAKPKLRLSGDKAVEARRAMDNIAEFYQNRARMGVQASDDVAAGMSRGMNESMYGLPEVGAEAQALNAESSRLNRVQDTLDKAGANPLNFANSQAGTELGQELHSLGMPEYQTMQQRFQGANRMVRDEEQKGMASLWDAAKTFAGKKPAFALVELAEKMKANPQALSQALKKPVLGVSRLSAARPALKGSWDLLESNLGEGNE